MGRLTTHVLDTASGRPAAGLGIGLFRSGEDTEHIRSVVTNDDGRVDAPLLEGDALTPGVYELQFAVGAYHARGGEPGFYDVVPIRFRITDPSAHYHVPLLISPFGYTTYRGS